MGCTSIQLKKDYEERFLVRRRDLLRLENGNLMRVVEAKTRALAHYEAENRDLRHALKDRIHKATILLHEAQEFSKRLMNRDGWKTLVEEDDEKENLGFAKKRNKDYSSEAKQKTIRNKLVEESGKIQNYARTVLGKGKYVQQRLIEEEEESYDPYSNHHNNVQRVGWNRLIEYDHNYSQKHSDEVGFSQNTGWNRKSESYPCSIIKKTYIASKKISSKGSWSRLVEEIDSPVKYKEEANRSVEASGDDKPRSIVADSRQDCWNRLVEENGSPVKDVELNASNTSRTSSSSGELSLSSLSLEDESWTTVYEGNSSSVILYEDTEE
ncbi:unnamed protein product [Meganyctiphanes norvegica]|uniref:Uncharacterized protein n=1 Tax=Meganyctiphanes norvegica TaxID=48144 RepID=A0AAV2RM83_MEGNR